MTAGDLRVFKCARDLIAGVRLDAHVIVKFVPNDPYFISRAQKENQEIWPALLHLHELKVWLPTGGR